MISLEAPSETLDTFLGRYHHSEFGTTSFAEGFSALFWVCYVAVAFLGRVHSNGVQCLEQQH
jgi:hypothetical protein